MDKRQICPLFEWCPSKTATCRVYLPDDGCYWYRWFKNLIQEDDKEKNKMNKEDIKKEIEDLYTEMRQKYTQLYLIFNPDEEEYAIISEESDLDYFKDLLCQI